MYSDGGTPNAARTASIAPSHSWMLVAGAIAPKRFCSQSRCGAPAGPSPKFPAVVSISVSAPFPADTAALIPCDTLVAYPVRLRHDAARRDFRIVLERLFNTGKGFGGESCRLQRGYTLPGCRAVWHVADMDYPLSPDVPRGELVDVQRVLSVRAGASFISYRQLSGAGAPGDDRAWWQLAATGSSPCAGSGQ